MPIRNEPMNPSDDPLAITHDWPIPHRLDFDHIFHPTDFASSPEIAFAHALKLTLASKAHLTIFHVNEELEDVRWEDFPHVRSTLARWGLIRRDGALQEIAKLGIHVEKVLARGTNPTTAILDYLRRHPADLVVLATHQLGGHPFFHSIAEPVARQSGAMTLFIPAHSQGFVSEADGTFRLRKILIPVDSQPTPFPAIHAASGLAYTLGCEQLAFTLLHVGEETSMPWLRAPRRLGWTWHITVRAGDVVDQILTVEEEEKPDLLVMTTQGHHGFLDALRGSTTERVLRLAHCPLLAVPAA